MNSHALRSLPSRQNLAAAAVTLSFLIVMSVSFVVTTARSPQNGQVASGASERAFENAVPEKLPVKVKIKSEKSFKDLKNKRWLRELEVEVKNTGSKPIYYVHVEFIMPEILLGGHEYATSAAYGRRELLRPETPVEPGDVPIMPGESATLKVSEKIVRGYEYSRDEEKLYTDPKRIVCQVQMIKFGDGTFLWAPDGKPGRAEPKSNSRNLPNQESGAEACRTSPPASTPNAPGGLSSLFNSQKPASLLRAYLLLPDGWFASAPLPAPDDCGCQSVFGCMWGRPGIANCPSCEEPEPAVIFAGGCGNGGMCLPYVIRIKPCPAESDPGLKCTWDDPSSGTCFIGDPPPPGPAPTPTPTPSPTPTPTPIPCQGEAPLSCCVCVPPPAGSVGLVAVSRLDGPVRVGV